MRILLAGSLAFDRIFVFEGVFADHILPEKVHDLNVSFFTPTMTESDGGCAGNIAYNLALLGETPVILARAGKDFGPYGTRLARRGADVTGVEIADTPTASATILTDNKGNQITAFHPGAMGTPYAFKKLEGDFGIVAPTNPDDMRAAPALFKDAGIPYLFDPGQQIPILSAEDLMAGITGAKGLISNDYELALILKKTGWREEDILANAELLITTLGEKGSRIRTKTETFDIPAAKPRAIVDPTGAGDAYRAGLVHGLLKGWPLPSAGRLAGLVACYTVEAQGTQTHAYTADDLAARYKENFNEPIPA